jgi:hypothetical protein
MFEIEVFGQWQPINASAYIIQIDDPDQEEPSPAVTHPVIQQTSLHQLLPIHTTATNLVLLL